MVVNKIKSISSWSLLSREIRERLKNEGFIDPREGKEKGRQ